MYCVIGCSGGPLYLKHENGNITNLIIGVNGGCLSDAVNACKPNYATRVSEKTIELMDYAVELIAKQESDIGPTANKKRKTNVQNSDVTGDIWHPSLTGKKKAVEKTKSK